MLSRKDTKSTKIGESGNPVADLLVDDRVLVELKAVKALDDIHLAQCMNYLKATGKKICLLINFGTPKIEVRRVVNNDGLANS